MSEKIRVSLTLTQNTQQKTVCCAKCGQSLTTPNSAEYWKDKVPVTLSKAAEIPGWSESIHEKLELRQFSCPACSALLDSEVALPEDPFLYDVVHV